MKTLSLIAFWVLICINVSAQTMSVKLNPGSKYLLDSSQFYPDSLNNNFQIGGVMRGDYLLATYNKKAVYIKYNDIEQTDRFKKFWDKYYIEPAIKKNELDFKNKNKELIDKYGKFFAYAILAHKIEIGMTSEMVLLSIGKPERISHSQGEYGSSDMWVYPYDESRDKYLFFADGKVSGWDTPVK